MTAEQREIFTSSPLDEYLLDAERDVRRRAQVDRRPRRAVARAVPADARRRRAAVGHRHRHLPRLPAALQVRARLPDPAGADAAPALRDRRAPGARALPRATEERSTGRRSTELLLLLDASWRRGGFGDSDEERQLRQKATAALTRYHERAQSDDGRPVWFERQFSFKLGPHLVRGRVDRVDRLPSGEYELIDYKTGRPKSAEQLANDVQLSLYAIGAREAWGLEATRGAYYYLLDDEKVAVSGDAERADWIRERRDRGRRGDQGAGVRADALAAGVQAL